MNVATLCRKSLGLWNLLDFSGKTRYAYASVKLGSREAEQERKNMKKYVVNVREVHVQPVRIEATSKEEAIEKIVKGQGTTVDDGLEYSHTLDSEFWTVEEEV